MNVETLKRQEIYKEGLVNSQFSAKSNLVAFISKSEDSKLGIYICKPGDQAKLMVSDRSPGIEKGFALSEQPLRFSPDGNLVYFKLRRANQNNERDSILTGASVDVWNWKDQFLMSRQLQTLKDNPSRSFTAVLNIKIGNIIQLENNDKELVLEGDRVTNKYVLVKTITSEDEAYYTNNQIPKYQLVSLIDGRVLNFELYKKFSIPPSFSPSERFLLWHANHGNIYTYEIATRITCNLTETLNLPNDIFYMVSAGRDSLSLNEFADKWLFNDYLLVKDKFDYWLLDPTGKKSPTCITEGYGRKNNIEFELAVTSQDLTSLRVGDKLLLKGHNLYTQESGFSIASINWNIKFEKAPFMPKKYGMVRPQRSHKEVVFGKFNYLLTRETVSESANLVTTKDFKTFAQISDIGPEKSFNWLTSEIMHWDMPEGKSGLGILYKPENFQCNKKYPVIFWYYQEETKVKSNQYITPDPSSGDLDIPWYVSNGYLVFSVDIPNYKPGKIANSTINSVVSAAKHLSQFQWVDSTKMGIQGHSFGGYETNLLVTNTNIFAAASSAAGLSNAISLSGSLHFGGRSGIEATEVGQLNLGANPWTMPEVYIENSPIFKVDKITTPLLLQNNKNDSGVPFLQGVEMFTAMRRAGKPVWLLQYDDQGHGLSGDAAFDYTVRQQQFFDHYLKGKPMPVWMSRGVAAKDKGIRSGLEYDLEYEGRESKTPCPTLKKVVTGSDGREIDLR